MSGSVPLQSSQICLYIIGFLDLLGISMILPLLVAHGEFLGASPVLNGAIASVYGALQLVSSPVCGSLSDSQGRSRVLTISLLCCCVSYAFLSASDSIALLIVSRVLAGGFKHTQTLCRTMAVDLTRPALRQATVGRFNAVSSMAFIVGPPIGGYLTQLHGEPAAVGGGAGFRLVTSCTVLLYLLMFAISVLFVRDPVGCDDDSSEPAPGSKDQGPPSPTSEDQSPPSPTSGVQSALSPTSGDQSPPSPTSALDDAVDWSQHYDLFTVRFFFSFSVLVLRANSAPAWQRLYALTPLTLGWLMSVQGLVASAAGLLTGPVSVCFGGDALAELAALAGLLCATLVATAAAPHVVYAVVALSALSACTSVLRACGSALSLQRTPRHHRGLVAGVGQNVAALARMVAPLAAGVVQQWAGDRGPAWAAAGTAAVAAALSVRMWKRSKRLKLD